MNSKVLIAVGALLAFVCGVLAAVGTTSLVLFGLYGVGVVAGFGLVALGAKGVAADRQRAEAERRSAYVKRESDKQP